METNPSFILFLGAERSSWRSDVAHYHLDQGGS